MWLVVFLSLPSAAETPFRKRQPGTCRLVSATPSTTRVYAGSTRLRGRTPYSGRARHQATFNLLREELPVEISADEDDLRDAPLDLLPLRLRRPEINLFMDSLKNELLIALPREGQDALRSGINRQPASAAIPP